MGVFAVVFFVLWSVNIPEPHITESKESMGSLISGALKFKHFVLGAIAIFIYVGIEVGYRYIMLYWLEEMPSVGATIGGFVTGTYWFLMLIGRLVGASLGSKVSSKTMLSSLSIVGLVLVLAAIFSPTTNLVELPVLQRSAEGALSFGLAEVPINALFFVLVGLCTSIMWGSIFNLAVEGLGKYTPAAAGIFMTMVCGGGILPAIQGGIADAVGYISSYWLIIAALAYLLFYGLIGSKVIKRATE